MLGLCAVTIAAAVVCSEAALAIEPALDARNYPGPAWSPYLVGAGIGVLSWLTFYFSDKPIGASSFYATVAGMLGKAVAPKHTDELDYFKNNPPKVELGIRLRPRRGCRSCCRGRDRRWLRQRMGAGDVARSLRRQLGAESGICVWWRSADGIRRPARRRVYQRSWYQRHAAAERRLLDRGDLLLYRRRRGRQLDVSDLGDARSWQICQKIQARSKPHRLRPPI